MAHRATLLAALSVCLAVQASDARLASACASVRLMVNSTSHPWTYYWTPPLSTLATATCGEVDAGTKFDDNSIVEVSSGLQQAVAMTKLTFDISSAVEIVWHRPAMDGMFAILGTLPLHDFTLVASEREAWPTDAIATFLKAVPKATSLTLKLANTKQTDDSVLAWVNALPAPLQSLSVLMQINDALSPAVADIFAKNFGTDSRFSSLQHIDVNLHDIAALTSESKIKIYQALQSRTYRECSLSCNNITDAAHANLSLSLAAVACIGHGNCNAALKPAFSGRSFPAIVVVIVIVMAIVVISLAAVYMHRRCKRQERQLIQANQWGLESSPHMMQELHQSVHSDGVPVTRKSN